MNEKEIKAYERRYEMIMNQIKQNKERTPSRNDVIEIENEYDMIDDLFQSNQRLLNMTTTVNTNERIRKMKEQQHEQFGHSSYFNDFFNCYHIQNKQCSDLVMNNEQ